jgi:3-vinyl bacteriochlorophyllide hydratase
MPLYTPEERIRRDASPWTLVQGILAPIQFLVFLASAGLVIHFLIAGTGFAAATISVVIKTLVLYAIMITGCIWERQVFGRYLFARAFFWEDFVSMFVLALHTAYLYALLFGRVHARYQMYIALLAYSAYLLNATQFLIKLRAARLESVNKDRAAAGPSYGLTA